MKLNNFAKSKLELEKQKEKNNQSFLQYDEQFRMAKTNQTEYKILTTLFFSLLSYLALFIGTAISLAIRDTTLFSSVPRLLYPVVIFGSSVGLGTITRIWMEKKFQLKERLSAFSNAKTDTEKIVEEIKNEIELKKIETRNLVLTQATEQLTKDEQQLRTVSEKYAVVDKEEKTQESAKEKASSLTLLLQEKFSSLDNLVAKQVISNRFFQQRQTGQSVMNTMMASVGSGVGAMMYYTITLMIASTHISGPLTEGVTGLLTLFSPAIITGTAVGIFYNARNKNYKKAFATLNETLKEEALPAKSKDTFEERQVLENLIDQTISEIVSATIELQEERRYLDSFNMESADDVSLEEPKRTKSAPTPKQTMEEVEDYTYIEEPTFEGMSTHNGLRQEVKKLTLNRNRTYKDNQ